MFTLKKIIFFVVICGLILFVFFSPKQEIANLNNPNMTIVAFGDSLTASKGASREHSYPAYLSNLLGKEVVNMGFSGETAVGAKTHLPQVLQYQPYMVLIEFGGNDFMHGENFEETIHSVEALVDAVEQIGAIAVVVDTGGPGMGKYSRAYKEIAKNKKAIFVPGILKGIFNKPQYKSDMIHPNAKGYEIIANRVYKEIKSYIPTRN